MGLNHLRMTAVLTTALAAASALAHLFALPNKMALSANDYFTAQRAYDGWALLGLVIIAALISTLWLARALKQLPGRRWASAAFAYLAAGLGIFFVWIFPANQQTHNWTIQPANWAVLRTRWELGHAVDAVLFFLALASVVWAAIRSGQADRPLGAG